MLAILIATQVVLMPSIIDANPVHDQLVRSAEARIAFEQAGELRAEVRQAAIDRDWPVLPCKVVGTRAVC